MLNKILKKITPGKAFFAATLGILICFSSISLVSTFSTKPLSTGDEALHLDYAWQVYNLKLPSFDEGPILKTDLRVMPDVQWTYQHPPLYYALLAPIVGPLIAHDNVLGAVAAGRIMNIVLGMIFILCVGWLAYLLNDRNRKSIALIAMAITSISSIFIAVSSAVYNDNLFLILSCLALSLTVLTLKTKESSWRLLLILAGVCALGMLSRITFAITLAFVLAALLIKFFYPRLKSKNLSLATFLWQFATIAAVPLLASTWFYLKNLQESGNLMGGQSEYSHAELGREDKSYVSVLTSPSFWETVGSILSSSAQIVTIITIALLFVWLAIRSYRFLIRREALSLPHIIDLGLILLLLAYVLMLLYYVSHSGGEHVRYLLPTLPILAYFLARYIVTVPSTQLFLALGLGVTLLSSSGIRCMAIISDGGRLFSGHFYNYLATRGVTRFIPFMEYGMLVYWFVGVSLVVIGGYLLFKYEKLPSGSPIKRSRQ